MKIDPDLEAFFVAIALAHGTHPLPKWGVERNKLALEITNFMREHPGQPEVLQKVRRNYAELGGKFLDTDSLWFYSKLADAYLDWLYDQPESKKLQEEAILEELQEDPRGALDPRWKPMRWL